MVFYATFNNIAVISWRSVLLVEETRISVENIRPVASHWQTLYHIMLYQVHLALAGFELTTLVVMGNDCPSSCKLITVRSRPRRLIEKEKSHTSYSSKRKVYEWNSHVCWANYSNKCWHSFVSWVYWWFINKLQHFKYLLWSMEGIYKLFKV
jgi:hypothetical protein